MSTSESASDAVALDFLARLLGNRAAGVHEPLAFYLSLYPGHVVIRCDTPTGAVELALGQSSLMGFTSWLEAGPPGAEHL